MRTIGKQCETCYSGRPARWVIDYDSFAICWVCKLRMVLPGWVSHFIINKLDRAGMARHEQERCLMPFDLGDWKPERPERPNIDPDPSLPVTGIWWRFLCRLGWHSGRIHPRNIWVDDEGPHAWSKCCGCGMVKKL